MIQQPTLIRWEFAACHRVAILFENPLRSCQVIRSAGGIKDEFRSDDLQTMLDRRGLRVAF